MEGTCCFCGERRDLINFGKVRICRLCEANQFREPRGKEVKASTAEFTRPMSGKIFANYARKRKSSFKLGPIE